MSTIWVMDGALVLFLAFEFWRDRFGRLNRGADWIEDNLFPRFLRYKRLGDPASWIQHGITAAAIADVWTLLGWAMGVDVATARLHGAVIAGVFYLVREGWQLVVHYRELGFVGLIRDWRTHDRKKYPGFFVGWGTDGFFDLWGPALVVWMALP